MNRQMKAVVDLGGTTIRLGFTRKSGKFNWINTFETKNYKSPYQWLDALLGDNPRLSRSYWVLGVPGPVKDEHVTQTPNLKQEWDKNAFIETLNERNLNYTVENDANLAALGIASSRKNKNVSPLLTVTLGTGIGGGIVINDELFRGHSGAAAEIGHITLQPGGRDCNCGKSGCLETYASATGLSRTYEDLTGDKLPGKKIYETDSQDSRKALKETGHYLGQGLGMVSNVINPEKIILSGGLTGAFTSIESPMRESFEAEVFSREAKKTPIEVTELENPALHGGLQLNSKRAD